MFCRGGAGGQDSAGALGSQYLTTVTVGSTQPPARKSAEASGLVNILYSKIEYNITCVNSICVRASLGSFMICLLCA